MADVRFVFQGLNETEDHYAALEAMLNTPNIQYCLIGVAFMNSAVSTARLQNCFAA